MSKPKNGQNDDYPTLETLSICVNCAKHPTLKRFIETHAVEGLACAVCVPQVDTLGVCAVERRLEMMSLLSGLIRFYYNEYEYNSYWGGNSSIEEILTSDNPILNHRNTLWNYREQSYGVKLLYLLFSENPNPDRNVGISIYAGFDSDGGRLLALSIKQSESLKLRKLRTRLRFENHFDVEQEVFELIEKIGDRISSFVPAGSRYFRARIGAAGRYSKSALDWTPEIRIKPFSGASMGAPPPLQAIGGRLNRANVAYLYLASDRETAAAEIRPHPGHTLSTGQFECVKPLRIASFNTDIGTFSSNDYDLDLFHFVHSTDELMSMPIIPEEASRYLVTQLIADCLRKCSFDGISYKSSVSRGENLCVFSPERFKFIDESGEALRVAGLNYGLQSIATINTLTNDYQLLE